MQMLIPFLVIGISVGAVYALSGVGLVMLYRASGVVNLAQGALGGLAAMVCWQAIELGYADVIGWVLGIACATLLSWAYGRFIAPTLSKQDRIVRAMATLGLAFMIMGMAQWYWGDAPRRLVLPTDRDGLQWNGRRLISDTRLLALGIAMGVTALMAYVLAKTNFGLKMRALQSDRMLSALVGVRVKRVDTWAWVIAGVLAGIIGLFMGNMVRLNPTVLTFLVIPALAAAVVGRMTSLPLTVLGGLAIGVIESMIILVPGLSRYGSATAFVVAILAILWYQRHGITLSRDNSHLE
jgi:branched-chain amino acid transport system permease protein